MKWGHTKRQAINQPIPCHQVCRYNFASFSCNQPHASCQNTAPCHYHWLPVTNKYTGLAKLSVQLSIYYLLIKVLILQDSIGYVKKEPSSNTDRSHGEEKVGCHQLDHISVFPLTPDRDNTSNHGTGGQLATVIIDGLLTKGNTT